MAPGINLALSESTPKCGLPMPAMTIANMIANGVRSVEIRCRCDRRTKVDVSGLRGEIEIPDLKHILRCRECGQRPILVQPDWSEHTPRGVNDDMLDRIPKMPPRR